MTRPAAALLLTLLLLTTLAAGCLGGDEGPDQPTEGGGQAPSEDRDQDGESTGSGPDAGSSPPSEQRPRQSLPAPFLLQGDRCHRLTLLVPTDRTSAEELLPEGFSATSYQNATGTQDPQDRATLIVRFTRCQQGGLASDQGTGQGFTWHTLALAARPPAPYQVETSQGEAFMLAATTDDEALAEALQARGWAVAQGSANLSLTATPVTTLLQASAQGGELATQAEGTLVGANASAPAGFTRLWHAPQERLEYLHDAVTAPHATINASGAVRSEDPASRTAQLVGPTSSATGTLTGPMNLLATPVLVEAGGSPGA